MISKISLSPILIAVWLDFFLGIYMVARPLELTLRRQTRYAKMGFAAVIALLERPWLVFPIFLMVCQFTRALYRVTLHPLAGYPGPTLAAVSRW